MNKVYVITAIDNSSIYTNERISLHGLYSTRDKALEIISQYETEDEHGYGHSSSAQFKDYEVMEVEVL